MQAKQNRTWTHIRGLLHCRRQCAEERSNIMKKMSTIFGAVMVTISLLAGMTACGKHQYSSSQGQSGQDIGMNTNTDAKADGNTNAESESRTDGLTGIKLEDFSVKTISGDEFKLSEVLKEKKAVLINLWASWCGPCESEFPYMQQAYDQYKKDVEILALSVENSDTDTVLTEYAKSHNLTFPVANDASVKLGEKYAKEAIPATLLVDRFGTVVYYTEGAATSTKEFTDVFDQVLGDEYTESKVIKDASETVSVNVEKANSETLSAAVNAEGGNLVFDNVADKAIWPMMIRESGGRTSLVSSNKGVAESKSEVKTTVKAEKGDVLAFDFHISSEPISAVLEIVVDGNVVKTFSGEYDWTTWGLSLDEGTHEVIFRYDRAYDINTGDDEALIDNVRVASGDEAKAILAALPVYHTADKVDIQVTNADAKEIVFELKEGGAAEDDEDIVGYDCQAYYIVPSDTADVKFTLTSDYDPGAAHGYNLTSYEYTPVTDMKTEGNAYTVKTQTAGTNDIFSAFYIYPVEESRMFDRSETEYDKLTGVMLFRSEDDVEAFIKMMKEDDFPELVWHYANQK